jgi:hypothetical protein
MKVVNIAHSVRLVDHRRAMWACKLGSKGGSFTRSSSCLDGLITLRRA